MVFLINKKTYKFKGIYFSEELKEVVKHGYKVNLIRGYEFESDKIFNEYVGHFYAIKKNSSGAKKFLAKLNLNTLYGLFGRRKDILRTITIKNEDLIKYLATHIVKNIISINDELSTLLVINNINYNTLKTLNMLFETDFIDKPIEVKTNVAIASSITSYARIHMIRLKDYCFKNGINIYYSDTDSLVFDKPLPDSFVSNSVLGMLKLEYIIIKAI